MTDSPGIKYNDKIYDLIDLNTFVMTAKLLGEWSNYFYKDDLVGCDAFSTAWERIYLIGGIGMNYGDGVHIIISANEPLTYCDIYLKKNMLGIALIERRQCLG